MKYPIAWKIIWSPERRLIRLGRCPGWSESLLGAQIILLILSWGGSVWFGSTLSLTICPGLSVWKLICIWATSWQNQQNDCAPSEDSDQPGHLPSLIRVFTVHSVGSLGTKLSSCGQRRLWSYAFLVGEQEIPGLTDKTIPRRLGPKRASKIRRLFNLGKEDDVRQYVVRRPLAATDSKSGWIRPTLRICLFAVYWPRIFRLGR